MKKIFYIFLLLIVFSFTTNQLFAVTTDSTTGFVSGNIWYSKSKLTEGDDVKIYTGFWNGENSTVSIKVSFFDGETLLGERSADIPALTLKDISIPWKVTVGDHDIRAQITKATSNQNGTNESVSILNNEVKSDSIFIPKKINGELGEEKLNEIGEKVLDVLPENVSEPVSTSVNNIDLFREKTEHNIENGVKEAKEKIKEFTNTENNTNTKTNTEDKKDSLDKTEKPLAYLQLILFSIALFIFSHKFIFYTLLIFFVFLILRFIYRKIRG